MSGGLAKACVQRKNCSVSEKIEFLIKEYMCGHSFERVNMVAECIVHVYIAAQLKAYWHLVKLLNPALLSVHLYVKKCMKIVNYPIFHFVH